MEEIKIQKLFKNVLELLEYNQKTNTATEQYTATVVEVLNNNKRAKVTLLSDNTIFEFINKTGEKLSVGDSVYVKAVNGSLSGAYISQRFGEPVWAADGGVSAEVDPTVPAWAKERNKPTYSASEVGALPANGTAVNAEKVNNLTVLTAVPTNAKFTDTIYTHPSSHPASMITGLPTSLPASDVYDWAKQVNKPSYNASEVGLGNVANVAQSQENWWHLSAYSGQPNWLWGYQNTNDYYLYNPSNFNVNSATRFKTSRAINGAYFDGTSNISIPISGSSDVQFSTLQQGQILQYNGSKWVNVELGAVQGVKKYSISVGNGSASSFTINHNLNSEDIVVNMYQGSTPNKNNIWYEIKIINANSFSVDFGLNVPSTNSVRIVVLG